MSTDERNPLIEEIGDIIDIHGSMSRWTMVDGTEVVILTQERLDDLLGNEYYAGFDDANVMMPRES